MFAGLLSVVVLGIPLGLSLNNILVKENVRKEIIALLKRQTLTFKETSIESINTDIQGNGVIRVELVRDFLSSQFNRPVRVKLKVIPAEIFEE